MGDAAGGENPILPPMMPLCERLPEALHRQMLAEAPSYDDACAAQIVSVGNRTRVGSRENLLRIGVSAGLGLLLGAGVGSWLARR